MTQIIKSKLTILAGIAGLLFLTACQIAPVETQKAVIKEDVTHRFTAGVSYLSVDDILRSLDKAEQVVQPNEIFTLVITSPGGLVSAYEVLLDRMSRSELHIRTKVHTYAASAGALMFLMGDERVMEENAQILFHYARIHVLGVPITAKVLSDYLSGKAVPTSETIALNLLKEYGVDLEELLAELTEINTALFKSVASVVGEEVASKLLVAGKDITIKGTEALEMGVATKVYKRATTRVVKKTEPVDPTKGLKLHP